MNRCVQTKGRKHERNELKPKVCGEGGQVGEFIEVCVCLLYHLQVCAVCGLWTIVAIKMRIVRDLHVENDDDDVDFL